MIKNEVDELKKDLAQSSIRIKTLKKEAKETHAKHKKAVKKNVQITKADRRERFKNKDKKLNYKIKTADEHELNCSDLQVLLGGGLWCEWSD